MTSTESTGKKRQKLDPSKIEIGTAEVVENETTAFRSEVPKDHPLWEVYSKAKELEKPVRVTFGEGQFPLVSAFLRKCSVETNNGVRIKKESETTAIIKVGPRQVRTRKPKAATNGAAAKPAAKAARSK